MQLNSQNQYLQSSGIDIKAPLVVKARVIDPPQILYENATTQPSNETFKWETKNFLVSSKIKKWGMYLLDNNNSCHQFSLNELRYIFFKQI